MQLVVGTYNVRHCRGLDGIVDPRRTAAAIRALQAGLVAVQEVDRGMTRSGGVDQAALLSEATGMHVQFFPTLGADGGEYGLALLSRAALEAHFVDLPRVAGEEPRGAVVAHVQGVRVIATHLSRSARARAVQTRALAVLATDEAGPVVVMGDLNQTARRLRPLRVAGLGGGPTRPTHGPRWRRQQIDHILAGRGAAVTDAWTVLSDASDHLPLAALVAVSVA